MASGAKALNEAASSHLEGMLAARYTFSVFLGKAKSGIHSLSVVKSSVRYIPCASYNQTYDTFFLKVSRDY